MIRETDPTRTSIADWLDRMASSHRVAADKDRGHRSYHRGIAILYSARANDVRAGMDVPADIRDLNTGEIVIS